MTKFASMQVYKLKKLKTLKIINYKLQITSVHLQVHKLANLKIYKIK